MKVPRIDWPGVGQAVAVAALVAVAQAVIAQVATNAVKDAKKKN